LFEVEAWDGRRGIVNVVEFEQRFGVKQLTAAMD
jgi:hypothetical protein